MPLALVTIPCLSDNYAYLIHDDASGETAVVDVPEAAPVLAALQSRGWRLTHILVTHHHADHVQGVEAVRTATGARVLGNGADAHRLPRLDQALADGDSFSFGGETGLVLDTSGHTVGHITYHFPASGLAFTADCLFAMGCGRIFEGTPAMMWASLCRIAALPPETLICCGHEYTQGNARFTESLGAATPAVTARIAEIDRLRAAGRPTVPSRLADERATNPFLRASDPAMKAALGMAGASDAAVFAEIRARKDKS